MTELDSDIKFKLDPPIVIDRRAKSLRSRAVDNIAYGEHHLGRAARRTVKATAAGLAHYEKAQRKSRAKKSKRYLFKMLPNSVDASAVTLRKLTLVPSDVVRAANPPGARKIIRRSIKSGAATVSRLLLP